MNFGTTEIILILAVFVIPFMLVGALIVVLVARAKKQGGATKKCPYCAEQIKIEAVVCRFCNRTI